MKKRLRKKKRLAEFTELGFMVAIRFTDTFDNPEIDAASWRVVTDCMEPIGLSVGGGFESLFVGRHRKSCTEADRDHVRAYLLACPEVARFVVGPLVDAWYVNGDDMDREYDEMQRQVREPLPCIGRTFGNDEDGHPCDVAECPACKPRRRARTP